MFFHFQTNEVERLLLNNDSNKPYIDLKLNNTNNIDSISSTRSNNVINTIKHNDDFMDANVCNKQCSISSNNNNNEINNNNENSNKIIITKATNALELNRNYDKFSSIKRTFSNSLLNLSTTNSNELCEFFD